MKVLSPIGTYWIIRHKPTGGYLPELDKPARGGYTHTEPVLGGRPPRLFTTERGAKNALWWWLRGVLTVSVTMGDFGAFSPEPEENWHTDNKGRKAEDMEIVKCDLSQVMQEIA